MDFVNGNQMTEPCPQCGSPAAVHSIQELADLARMQLDRLQQGPPGGQPGWQGQPPPGPGGPGGFGPMLGPSGTMPDPSGTMPDPSTPMPGPSGPMPGQSGPTPGPSGGHYTPGEDLASAVLSEAARFIGRAIGHRVQRTYTERVQPPLAARGEEVLRTQIAIAERHPDIRACLNDGVIFLTGGQRVLPMPNLPTLTVEQADALVANLRSG